MKQLHGYQFNLKLYLNIHANCGEHFKVTKMRINNRPGSIRISHIFYKATKHELIKAQTHYTYSIPIRHKMDKKKRKKFALEHAQYHITIISHTDA